MYNFLYNEQKTSVHLMSKHGLRCFRLFCCLFQRRTPGFHSLLIRVSKKHFVDKDKLFLYKK